MNTKPRTAQEAFFLAHYAHNKLAPLLDFSHQSMDIEVGRRLSDFWHVDVKLYNWDGTTIQEPAPTGERFASMYATTKADIDRLAEKVEAENARLAAERQVEVAA